MLISPQNTLVAVVDIIWCRCWIRKSCQQDCSLDFDKLVAWYKRCNKTPNDQQKNDIYPLSRRAKPLSKLLLLHDSPAHTMEQNNIADKIMLKIVIVFEGLLELWNDVESQHWPTNDNDKTINFMATGFYDGCLWIPMVWVLSRRRNFHGVPPNIWQSFY